VGQWGQLKAATFFLWSYLKAKVYEIRPVGTPDFKCKLATYWSHPNNLLQCVMASVPEWIQECRGGKGGHLKACFQCWRLQLICHWVKNVCICLLIVPFLTFKIAFQKLSCISIPRWRNFKMLVWHMSISEFCNHVHATSWTATLFLQTVLAPWVIFLGPKLGQVHSPKCKEDTELPSHTP